MGLGYTCDVIPAAYTCLSCADANEPPCWGRQLAPAPFDDIEEAADDPRRDAGAGSAAVEAHLLAIASAPKAKNRRLSGRQCARDVSRSTHRLTHSR